MFREAMLALLGVGDQEAKQRRDEEEYQAALRMREQTA